MKKQRVYEVTDLEEFIKSLRSIILENFYEGEEKRKSIYELDELMRSKRESIDKKLTIQEAKSIIEPMLKVTKSIKGEIEYTISHKNFKKTLDELNRRIISNILTELSSEGLLETGFDEEKNDFIFWIPVKKI